MSVVALVMSFLAGMGLVHSSEDRNIYGVLGSWVLFGCAAAIIIIDLI